MDIILRHRRLLLALLVAAAVVALLALITGCGDEDRSGDAGNATDTAFVNDMVPHHEGAIEMAEVATKRAEHAEVRQLAEAIIKAQEAEISVMRTIADDLGHRDGEGAGGHMGMSQEEMGMDMDMPMLREAKPFDRAFIDMMIPHHQGAIRMARAELDEGSLPALRQMARDIIAAQTSEIDQMQRWRKAWYGSSSGSHSMMDG